MKRLVPASILLGLAAGFLVFWFTPAQVVKRRTESFLKVITLDASENPTRRQLGAYSLNALLAEQVELESTTIHEANGSFARSQLESAYAWLCQQARQTRFHLVKFQSVTVTGNRAEVSFTVDALVELPNYRPADGSYQAVFHWHETHDGWRLAKARWTTQP